MVLDDEDADDEMMELQLLDVKAEKYGHDKNSSWYKKSIKLIQKKYLQKRAADANVAGPVERKRREKPNWQLVKTISAKSWDDAINLMKKQFIGFEFRPDRPSGGLCSEKKVTFPFKRFKADCEDGDCLRVRLVELEPNKRYNLDQDEKKEAEESNSEEEEAPEGDEPEPPAKRSKKDKTEGSTSSTSAPAPVPEAAQPGKRTKRAKK